MDLHGLARGLISAVNPETPALVLVSTGYRQDDQGRQIPEYDAPVEVAAQVQDLSQKDILHLASLNIQGSQKILYMNGSFSGLSRPLGKGTDLVKFDNGDVWAITAQMEQWPDWCRVAATRQNGE